MTRHRGPRTIGQAALVLASAAFVVFGIVGTVSAHDEISTSDPANQSQIDDPISEVTVEFGESVADIEMAIANPDDIDLDSTTTQLTETRARLEFEPLSQEGRYIVRYIAQEDGHLITGAITFVYGSEDAPGVSGATWAIVVMLAIVILGIGAFFTLKRSRRSVDADNDDDGA